MSALIGDYKGAQVCRAQQEQIAPSGGPVKGRSDQVVGQAPRAMAIAFCEELIYLCNPLFSTAMGNLFNFPQCSPSVLPPST